MNAPHLSGWLWLAVAILPLVPLLSMLTVLLERSGPIRMRHWVEEAGGRLRTLYEDPLRFEVFRYLLNVFAKLLPLALFASLAATADAGGVSHALTAAGLAVAAVIAGTELASRSLLGRDPEEALRRLTWVYRFALVLLMPVVLVVTPILPRRAEPAEGAGDADETASEEEVEAFIDVGTKEGILEPEDRDLVWGVVDFGDTQVRSVMTPRVDMVVAPLDSSLDALAEVFTISAYSRIPLYKGSIDQIAGVLHIRDLFGALRGPEPRPSAEKLATPPFLVPETKLLGDLLKELQARRQQLAIVINEWGGTEGLVTLEDLLEEIVGEIADEHDEAAELENRLLDDGSLRIDGRAALSVLDDFFAWRAEGGLYETVGGMISGLLGRVPDPGETLEHDGLRFEIEKADERRILLVRVRRAGAEQVVS
jgi:putative hemolysin